MEHEHFSQLSSLEGPEELNNNNNNNEFLNRMALQYMRTVIKGVL